MSEPEKVKSDISMVGNDAKDKPANGGDEEQLVPRLSFPSHTVRIKRRQLTRDEDGGGVNEDGSAARIPRTKPKLSSSSDEDRNATATRSDGVADTTEEEDENAINSLLLDKKWWNAAEVEVSGNLKKLAGYCGDLSHTCCKLCYKNSPAEKLKYNRYKRNGNAFHNSGGFEHVVSILQTWVQSPRVHFEGMRALRNAAGYLRSCSKDEEKTTTDCTPQIVSNDEVHPSDISVLKTAIETMELFHDNEEVLEMAMDFLRSMFACSVPTSELQLGGVCCVHFNYCRKAICSHFVAELKGVKSILGAMKRFPENERIQWQGAFALYNLARKAELRSALLEAGFLGVLMLHYTTETDLGLLCSDAWDEVTGNN